MFFNKRNLFITSILLMSNFSYAHTPINAKYTLERAENTNENSLENDLVLPYAFATESMGWNFGVGFASQGYEQEQLAFGGTVYSGGEDSYGVYLGMWNWHIPNTNGLFLSIDGFYGQFPEQTAYGTNGSVSYPINQPFPGSSNSDYEQFLRGSGNSSYLDIKFEYVFPFGDNVDSPIKHYETRGGLVTNAARHRYWNPMEIGTTTIMLKQFNTFKNFDDKTLDNKLDYNANGLEVGIQYDYTDFAPNPTIGGRQYFGYSRDGDILSNSVTWDFLGFETSHYFNLGKSKTAKQRVLAVNLWTGYSPSWEVVDSNNSTSYLKDSPPFDHGATLGGWYRMRGYEAYRFHDKAVLYTTAEYRHTLEYNPANDIDLLKLFKIDWFQVVPFVEIGQVSSSYDLSDLTSNMKIDGGVSLRAMASGLVVRFDYAYSEEGQNMWVMVNHPF